MPHFSTILREVRRACASTVASAVLCVSAVGLTFVAVRTAHADYSATATAPRAGLVNRTGLSVRCETRGVCGPGYLPIKVTIATSPLLPSTETRRIRVVANVQRHPAFDNFEREIELPAGETSRTETIYLTLGHATHWNYLQFNFFERGRELEALQCAFTFRNQRYSPNLELEASLLFIDDDAPPRDKRATAVDQLLNSQKPARLPDLRWLSYRLSGPGLVNNSRTPVPQPTETKPEAQNEGVDAQTLLYLANADSTELLSTAELPTRWLNLSSFTVTFIPWTELEQLVKAKDDRWSALRRWVSSGGTLIVHDVGTNFERLRALEKLVGLSSLPPAHDRDQTPGWYAPLHANWGKSLADYSSSNNGMMAVTTATPFGNSVAYVGAAPQPASKQEDKSPADRPADSMSFVTRELGLGLVVAINKSDAIPGYSQDWEWLFNHIGDNRFRPARKSGLTRVAENTDFANFLVRNVGQAPVFAFITLITLFAIFIGPVNYFLLRRRKRLYVMLVTVPGAALVVTVSLVAYAVLADGLHVRSRIRSVTHVDQIGQTSSSWSRQVYFAGMVPKNGLSYPAEAFVQPIDRWGEQFESRRRRLEWTDDSQRYQQGYISARTMSQMLVIDPHPTTIGLRIITDSGEPGGCRVRNELGVGLSSLIIRDELGRYYYAPRLDADQELALPVANPGEAGFAQELKDFGSDSRLEPPLWNDSRTYRRRFGYYYGNQVSVSTSSSLLETQFSRVNVTLREMPRRTYMAIADSPLETPVGAVAEERQPDAQFVTGAW